jgi:DNA mismatch repair protein MutS2
MVFKSVFADIGDEQSIEQNLSTFSSHMTNIVEIINRSDGGTLALLDEIGAGTDPREGAVLARVILEHLTASGALTISTTHYGEMKTLAYSNAGFINGSFEFDDEHLSPTYKLRIGVPGSSKAITIASRLGLQRSLVEAAQAFLSSDRSDIQELIEQLEERLTALADAEAEVQRRQQQLEQLQQQTLAARAQIDAERKKLRAGLAGQMENELQQARELVRSLIADLQKQPSIAKAQRLQKDLEVLRDELGWLEPAEYAAIAETFQVGQAVKVRSLNQRGIIEALPEPGKTGSEAQATVRAGAMKIRVPLSDLQPMPVSGHAKATAAKNAASRAKVKPAAGAHGHGSSRVSASASSVDVFVRTTRNTIDLRGQRVEEALANVERFVDSAYLERLSPLMIIHGHGTGQLRAAVRKFLTESLYGVNWRPGENYEGGDGVTVVQFN